MSRKKLKAGVSCNRVSVKLTELEKHKTYQRKTKMREVRKIVDNFVPIRCLPLIVSKRRGKLYVIDGWHRVTALLELGERTWDAIVYTGLSARDEAREFRHINQNANPLSLYEQFQARVFEKEKAAIDILEVVKAAGFVLCWESPCSPKTQTGKEINAIGAVDRLYCRDGGKLLARTLEMITLIWNREDRFAVENSMLKGLSMLLDRCFLNGEYTFDAGRLKEKLSKRSASWILQRSDQKYNDLTGRYPRNRPTCIALSFVEVYNEGLGRKKGAKIDVAMILDKKNVKIRRRQS